MAKHYFATSAFGWHAAKTLREVVNRQHGTDQQGRLKTNVYAVFEVPLPVEAEYEIRNFAPQVEGVVKLGEFEHVAEEE